LFEKRSAGMEGREGLEGCLKRLVYAKINVSVACRVASAEVSRAEAVSLFFFSFFIMVPLI
jgi:hypothetical protein